MGMKTVQDASLTSVADAIRLKAEIEGTLEFPAQFISAIRNIPTGGGASAGSSDVNFYDYDGTITNSYSAEDFASLASLPKNPKHTGLTAQGWNWSLADAKAYVAKYGKLNIGQMYVTTSGDTEIDIQLGIGRNKPYLGCCPNGTVDIDWGDGSAHDTLTGTSVSTLKSIQHVYPDTGEVFTIKLHMESGSLGFIGNVSSSTGSQMFYNGTTGSTNGQRAYQNAVKAVRCGSHVTSIESNAFRSCYSLASVTIPESVTSISQQAFHSCYSLASVTIPEGVTSIGNYTFNACYSLASVTIPESVTSIGQQAFYNCYSLASVTIPESVTSIGQQAFQSCSSLAHLIFEPTTPPTAGSNAFGSLPSDLVVYVPVGTLADYQAASNYSSIASKMVEMPA